MSVTRDLEPDRTKRPASRDDHRLALLICFVLGFGSLIATVVLVALHAPATAVVPVAGVAAASIAAVVKIMVSKHS